MFLFQLGFHKISLCFCIIQSLELHLSDLLTNQLRRKSCQISRFKKVMRSCPRRSLEREDCARVVLRRGRLGAPGQRSRLRARRGQSQAPHVKQAAPDSCVLCFTSVTGPWSCRSQNALRLSDLVQVCTSNASKISGPGTHRELVCYRFA